MLLPEPLARRFAAARAADAPEFEQVLIRITELPLRAPIASAKPLAPSTVARGGRVVLVDDDVEIRCSMQLLLQGWGYELVSGATLAEVEAELAACEARPDAAIVDYRLADDMTGAHVIERLRSGLGAARVSPT